MLKKLILIEGSEKYQFDTVKELVELIIDKKYYELTEENKKEKLKLKAVANCMFSNLQIVNNLEELDNIEGKFIIADEITYIYSLLLLNKVTLLESRDANLLATTLNKEEISENYIIVNKFAKELLKKYLDRK